MRELLKTNEFLVGSIQIDNRRNHVRSTHVWLIYNGKKTILFVYRPLVEVARESLVAYIPR